MWGKLCCTCESSFRNAWLITQLYKMAGNKASNFRRYSLRLSRGNLEWKGHMFKKLYRRYMIATVLYKRRIMKRKKRRKIENVSELTATTCPNTLCGGLAESKAATKANSIKATSSFAQKLQSKLDAGRFRWINEQLYTSTGRKSAELFKGDLSLYQVYHKGFAAQVDQWPVNPLDHVIQYVRALPKDDVIADLGCGEGRLAEEVRQKVLSFDLVASKKHIVACDMAHLPLSKESVDVVIFCLSLMGTNLSDFLEESWRILVLGGTLKVVEVVSRIKNRKVFVKQVEGFGYKKTKSNLLNKMFIDLEFRKTERTNNKIAANISLNPCLYKKR